MKQLVTVLTMLGLMIGSLVAVPGSVYAQGESEPIVNVLPTVGPRGARFAFYAKGFDANERVGVWLNTPDGRAIAAEVEQLYGANGNGRADWYWTAPDDAEAGMWYMVARGIDSHVERIIPFEISPEPVPDVNANVVPRVGPPGARFTFFAKGFQGGEQVYIWLNTPDGRAVAADAAELLRANGNGRADWDWTSPANAEAGMWQMVARGAGSGLERVIWFEIR